MSLDLKLDPLIIEAKLGNKKALAKLLKYESNYLFSFFSGLNTSVSDIDDIVQSVLLKISNNIKNLEKISSYNSWVKKIAMNTFYDYVRLKNKYDSKNLELSDKTKAIPDYTTNPYKIALSDELNAIIDRTISNLPSEFKKAITLREYNGYSYEKIAKMLNIKTGTVKSRIARARNLIKNNLKDYISEK